VTPTPNRQAQAERPPAEPPNEPVSPFGRKTGLGRLLAADFLAQHPRPASLRFLWLWRLLVAVLVVGFNLGAMILNLEHVDPSQSRSFLLASLPYAAAVLVGCAVHLLARGRRPRLERTASLTVVGFEALQVGISLSYVGMGQAVSIGYLLVMILLYSVFVDALHGLLAFLGNTVSLSAVYGLITAGVIREGRLYLFADGAAGEPAFQVFGQTLTLMAVLYFMSETAGARLRWQQGQLEAQNRYIIEKILRRYLPPGLVDDLLAREDAWQRPRRMNVTVFFSDLVGFTRQSEQLDVDRLGTCLDEYLKEVVRIAHEYGGTVDKFIGDAVMVVFGSPAEQSPVEQASRVVGMAVAMQGMTRELAAKWAETAAGFEPVARMGIHYGEAVVGNFGGAERSDFTAVGDTVNIAARLEQACRPGEILVSEAVFELLGGRVPGRCQGELFLRNREKPVAVYEIIQETPPPRV